MKNNTFSPRGEQRERAAAERAAAERAAERGEISVTNKGPIKVYT